MPHWIFFFLIFSAISWSNCRICSQKACVYLLWYLQLWRFWTADTRVWKRWSLLPGPDWSLVLPQQIPGTLSEAACSRPCFVRWDAELWWHCHEFYHRQAHWEDFRGICETCKHSQFRKRNYRWLFWNVASSWPLSAEVLLYKQAC